MTHRSAGSTGKLPHHDGLDDGPSDTFDASDLSNDVDLQLPIRTLPVQSDLGADPLAGVGACPVAAQTITFVSGDGGTGSPIPSLDVSQPSAPDVAATTGSGLTITQAATQADGSITETVTFAGSGIVFNNTFASGLTQAYINCALAAEQTIASQWNNAVTINVSFTAQAEGLNGELASNGFYVDSVSYATLKSALTSLASREPGDTYLQQAVAHLPSSDPSGGAGFDLALPYARMLGLTTVSESPDDIVTLNTSYNWSYGQDVINALTHEISEGGMGRIGGLGDQNSSWSVMDLFRYNSSGVPDYTDGRDNRTTYFSYNGGATLSSLSFNNEYSGSSHVNNGDTADFTQLDVFGTGSPGETNTLSPTDIQVMEALGWMSLQGPVVSVANSYLATTSVAASSLFTVSDPNGLAITNYSFMDTGPGHFVLNGVTEPDNTEIDITAAQLSELTYQSVPGMADTVQIRAEDALTSGGWTSFVVTAPQVLIQADADSLGVTRLFEVAGQYALENASGNGPHLQVNGASVTVGQLSPWVLIGAALTATGYEVALQDGSSFIIWNTDSNGNYVSQSSDISGTSTALELYETSFHQDLNGDGTIGVTSTLIESSGATSLVAVADQYALENSSGNGPHLQLNGAPVVAGQEGPWSPVAAVQTSTGYEVAWQDGNSFMIWNTDGNGNYLSSSSTLAGTSTALEIAETVFHHDLNGDGTIGVTSTLIESNGTTSLVAVADQYALENSSGNGPHLQVNGAPVVAGELGSWTLVAAAQTATGYDVALQDGNYFVIWNVDSNGNYVSQSTDLSGTSLALEQYESVFHHDLNGDGTTGVTSTPIESNGTTLLVAVADQYALENNSGNGPHLQVNGSPVVTSDMGSWSLVAAAQTATGYGVALQDGNIFVIWNTDSNGNYVSQSADLSGTSLALEQYETIFNHDLNGDGVVGVPSSGGATVAAAATTAGVHSDNFSFRQDLSGAGTISASHGNGATDGATAAASAWHVDGFSFHQDHQGDGSVGVLPQHAPMQAHLDGFHQHPGGDETHGGGATLIETPTAHWHFDLIA